MTIGIDIRILAKGARTGVEDYTINLLSHLLPIDKFKYRLFYNGMKKPNLNYSWIKSSNIKIKKFRIPNRIFDLFLRFLKFPKIDMILGPVDVFLSPHFLLAPVSKKTKTIIIFYDLSFIRFPEFFSLPKLLWHKFIYPQKQAQKANLIIAISESTKEDLINLYKIKPEKIKVIYPGIDEKFIHQQADNRRLSEVENKYQLPDKFILYFGTIEPRKNILAVLKAFEEIKKMRDGKILEIDWQGFEGIVKNQKERTFNFSELKLVIAGTKGWLCDEIFEVVKNSEFKNDVIFTGFIDEEDKSYLYNLAEVFVYPSFFEGFGLPPLEAMACGTPTIVSNKSSLSEVVGNAAIMIDPQNIDELVFAIKEVLGSQELNNYLRKQGIERAKQFNWDNAAKKVISCALELMPDSLALKTKD
ncbi:glycosyltransferase family 4 protein [Patescibacteria group bacterium]|nr:glycosyltransferase family 4 protein [Patescibacteria group bacterium]MBU4458554.1 glycosyltransferase family 4 protein [Patescibacteria group bacterium]MCG2696305.1 glycosyltransferase family 4 protein [Candidatus Portnoybacteria bacterium]